jgi:ABC-2 type transport system permease protein
MRNILIIARRDLRAQFNSPVAYVVLGGTMLLLGVIFFKIPHMTIGSVFLGGFWELDRASVEQMFTYLPPILSFFVIPAVTMRSLAAEKGTGTLELLITMPVRDSEVILGKYLAACTMVLILLAATLVYPVGMFAFPWRLGPLDWGPVASGYLGCVLFTFAAVGIGMMFSSLTESDVIAFFLTMGTFVLLYMVGVIAALWNGNVFSEAVDFISLQSRFAPFTQGLIDTRAVIYLLSIAALCLLVSFRSLESRRWS